MKEDTSYILHRKDKCEECGETNFTMVGNYRRKLKILTVHHIDCNHLNNSIDNLQTLCRDCHSKKHNKKQLISICFQCGGHIFEGTEYETYRVKNGGFIYNHKDKDICKKMNLQ